MKSERLNLRTVLLIIAEASLLFAAVVAAAHLRFGADGAWYELTERYGFLKALVATAFCLSAFYLFDLYDFSRMHDRRELAMRMLQALGFAWIALAVLFYIMPRLMIGRGVSLISMLFALGFMIAWRTAVHYLMGHPNMGERVLVVGSGDSAIEVAREVLARRDAGYRVVGFVDSDPSLVGKSLINPKVIGVLDDLEKIVKRERIERIVVAQGERRGAFPTEQLLRLSLSGEMAIEECAAFYERLTGRVSLQMMRPSWLIFSSARKRQATLNQLSRIIFHRGTALVAAILSMPIWLLAIIAIKLESKGAVLYRQERVGKNGKPFQVLKFRSMRTDAEKDGPVWARTADDRVTRVGRIIRKTRIDEIPQCWNILKGDMNFVGPRPERPHFVRQLAEEIPYYEQRHLIAPGLTGWAQIKYPYGASVEDARQKLQYDLYYVKNQSLMLDAIIIFETTKTIIFGHGAR